MKKRNLRNSAELKTFLKRENRAPWSSEALRYVWSKVRSLRYLSASIIVLTIASIALRVVEPQMARLLFSTATTSGGYGRIILIFGCWVAIHAAKSIFTYLKTRGSYRFSTRTISLVRQDLASHFLRLPTAYYDSGSTGYILSRNLDDTDNLDGVLLPDAVEAIFAAIELLVIMAILFSMNRLLSAVSLILFAVGSRLRTVFPLRTVYSHHNELKALLTKHLTQAISGIGLIKTSATSAHEKRRLRKAFDRYARARFTRDDLRARQSAASAFADGFSTPVILVLGGVLALKGSLEFGALLAVLLYHPRAQAAFSRLIVSVPRYNTGKAYADRIWESLSLHAERDEGTREFHGIDSEIEFRNVSFSYGDDQVLKSVSFRIQKGSTVAVVGPSGGGKSTIVRLLMRLYEPESGSILMDGIDIRDYDLDSFRRNIGFVAQEPFLFSRTIRDNVAYRSPGEPDEAERIHHAIEKANAEVFVNQLPSGILTTVGERGVRLSGGERQRICIAREIYTDPPLLLLDEATSALDTISEKAVQEGIERAKEGRTALIVAHRLSTIQNADEILVVDDGELAERGTYDRLIEADGLFARMHRSQNAVVGR